MTRATLLLALVLTAALVGPAASQQHDASTHDPRQVSVGFDSVTPDRLDIVTGETVRWTNDSTRTHTVTADDASFDSGRLGGSQTFSRRFASVGAVPYHCTLHPSIKGVVAAQDLLLDPPAHAAAPNTPFPLTGRASAAVPAGADVSIEADTGAGFAAVGTTTLKPDGAFSARVSAPAGGRYRAVAGGVTSAPVSLVVLDRQISLTAQRARGRVVLRTAVTPAMRGGRVVLQLYLPARFGWWPVQSAKLDARSAARFVLHPRRRLRARVRLTLPDEATTLATSRTLRIGPPGNRRMRVSPQTH